MQDYHQTSQDLKKKMEMEYNLGKRERKLEIAENLPKLGIDETTISKSTELLPLYEIQKIKEKLGK